MSFIDNDNEDAFSYTSKGFHNYDDLYGNAKIDIDPLFDYSGVNVEMNGDRNLNTYDFGRYVKFEDAHASDSFTSYKNTFPSDHNSFNDTLNDSKLHCSKTRQTKVLVDLETHPFLNEAPTIKPKQETERQQFLPENFLSVPFSSSIYNSKLTIGERMKLKRLKARKLFGKSLIETDVISHKSSPKYDELDTQTEVSFITKKPRAYKKQKGVEVEPKAINDIKVLRNRVAAQKSRDKKKMEIDIIKGLYEKSLDENKLLVEQNNELKARINSMETIFDDLCSQCSAKTNCFTQTRSTTSSTKEGDYDDIFTEKTSDFDDSTKTKITKKKRVKNVTDSNVSSYRSSYKLGVFGALFVVVCIIGAFFSFEDTKNNLIAPQNIQAGFPKPILPNGRLLLEFPKLEDQNQEVLRDMSKQYEKSWTKEKLSAVQERFKLHHEEVSKLEKQQIQAKLNQTKTKSVASYGKISFAPFGSQEYLENFLEKKNNEYRIRLNKRIDDEETEKSYYTEIIKTLSNTPFSLRNEKMSWNIFHEEESESDKSNQNEEILQKPTRMPEKFLPILSKSSLRASLDVEKQESNKIQDSKSLVSVTRETTESKKEISSLLCLNYLSNKKNIFEAFTEKNKKSKDDSKQKEIYLHIILPDSQLSSASKKKSSVNDEREREMYYEVGCKVMEINRIYK